METMAKRIPKTKPPETLSNTVEAKNFSFFAEVCIPGTPQIFTYGCRNSSIKRGSVVWVCLAKRKKPLLALVLKITTEVPPYPLKEAHPHASNYCFSERYMHTLEWCAKYYLTTLQRTLNAFWPADFEKFLDALIIQSSSELSSKYSNQEFTWPELTLEQKDVLSQIEKKLNSGTFQGILLHGVTGSGKTRIYQELAKQAIRSGKKVLILVPEISLTSQTLERFEKFLGIPIAVLHSALSAPKKRASYVSILNGSAKVVLGTRSAILSPFEFDVVILDEEQDSSFKQQDPAPRYHTRDLAYHIAYRHQCLVLLGSATPSIETYFNAKKGNLEYLTLLKRATNIALPKIHIVDMREQKQQKGLLLSYPLREALTETLQANEQAIILMNRRGYSKIRLCQSCGEPLFCKHCKIPLVYHKQHQALLCHYCNCLYPTHIPCSECGADTFEFSGGAIEKLEEEILEWIPEAKVIRMDRDTTQNIGATEKILTAFRNREYNILLGTQMVSKGHDFPFVRLVGIVNADDSLCLPDFRTGERLFQLLSQTAGRAGRSGNQGSVWIQTMRKKDPIIQFAIHHNYNDFAIQELQNRELALYPPYCKFLTLSCGSKDSALVPKALKIIDQEARKIPDLKILGPMEALVPFVQNTYWMKISFKFQSLSKLRNFLQPLIKKLELQFSKVEFKLDLE